MSEQHDRPEGIWCFLDVVAVETQHLARRAGGEDDRSREDGRAERLESERERGHDPEVPAATPERPEEIRMFLLAGRDEGTVGGDDIGSAEVVACEPKGAHEPADAAAEGEARNAGSRRDPAGDGEAECLSLVVEIPVEDAGLQANRSRRGIDTDSLHAREIQHQAVVPQGRTCDVVPAGTHGQRDIPLAGEAQRGEHVGHAGAARDSGRSLVDHGVPEGARRIEAGSRGQQHLAPELVLQGIPGSARSRCGRYRHRSRSCRTFRRHSPVSFYVRKIIATTVVIAVDYGGR